MSSHRGPQNRPGGRSKVRASGQPGTGAARKPAGAPRSVRSSAKSKFDIVERDVSAAEAAKELKPVAKLPFRVLIAVHRPRYRGRTDRAAALVGWEVTSLLNKQDVVGQVAKPPAPPNIVVLSGDFGRQRDYAIFRAIQPWRTRGMTLIGMVEDCETAPEGYPDSAPAALCDVCLTPPYKTVDLRAVLAQIYERTQGRPVPPPKSADANDLEDME